MKKAKAKEIISLLRQKSSLSRLGSEQISRSLTTYYITSPAVDDANVIAEFGGLIDMNYETRNKSFDNADRIKLEEAEGYVLQTLAVSAQASLLFSSLTHCHCPPVTSQAPPHFQIR